ncbi:pheromone precursor [Trametes sanguinea]|nr:pheromone precursor [Trametes sanguinea]
MDAFFTIAPAVPVEAPADVPMELDSTGTNGDHGSCTIA